MPLQIKSEFQDLLTTDSDLFNWIMEDAHLGIVHYNLSKPQGVWTSDSFKKTLGFDASNAGNDYNDTVTDLIKKSGGNDFEDSASLKNAEDNTVSFKASGKFIVKDDTRHVVIKFSENKPGACGDMENPENLNRIYETTNTIAKIGGWASDVATGQLIWTNVTKDIHEVDQDYEPTIEKGVSFFKEGWSRDKLTSLFNELLEKGTPFDAELKIITAKGNEKWIHAFGKPEFEKGKCVRIFGAFQDIDFKKKQEEEYLLTRERFETIFNYSAVGIVLVNTNNKILMANPASIDIFGYAPEDKEYIMHYMSYKDMVHPDDLPNAVKLRTQLLAGEIPSYTMESRFFRNNGATIWCRVNTSLVKGHNGSDDLIITQVEDITISKRLEELATENSNRFISAFEYSPNGMALVGLDGSWLMVNETMSQMLGYDREEFLTLTFQNMTHPEDLDADLRLLHETLDNKRKTYSIEKRYIHKSGNIVYGLLNVSLIRDPEGQPLYFISQINNITKRVITQLELQKSLNELENLMNATTQVAIIEADITGIITKYNKGAENLLGYKPGEVIGKHNVGIFHVEEEVAKRAAALEAKHGRPFSGFEVFTHRPKQGKYDAADWTFIRKDGSSFSTHLVITSVLNPEGEITGYLGIATDISTLKEMEVSLMLERDKAEAASRSKSEFLANMSHEIRTPLNGVIGFSDLLMKTELNDSQRKYMQMVNTSAHSLLDIINDILDFSKIEAGKLELNEEKTDIIQLCSQTIDIVKHQAHAKSLEILLDITPGLDRYIYADPVRLRQILVNLLGNAVKFTTDGEVELKVRANPDDYSNEMLFSFAIRDTGIGIAPQNIDKIFNAFDQEDASTTRKYGGTGLGITISNKLLALMGSELEVESELGKGSTFSFKIKFRTEKDSGDIKKTKVNVKNVLVVDDNANNLTILKEMLAVAQIKTTLASNGIEALEILENNTGFDLAIVDYNMPYLTGTELVKQIRETLNIDANELPVMLLHSSIDDEKLIQDCIDLDIRFNVTKPILSDDLYDLLDNIHKPDSGITAIAETTQSVGFDALYNVLIAEDNPVNQMLAKTIIQKIVPNAAIMLAENGLEAVKAYQTQELDIIFMDIQMPEMSGFEATEQIRLLENGESRIPIVAITARALVGEKEECIKLGMDDYITKPINYDALQEIIRKYLVNPYNDRQV
ncbi:PAS domain S-box protein [Flavobacterium sp. DG1-102-2]|uniref:PAS domain-containing hybrid sensor histidine kinase/response regulator n=1 Tax=Flavobacterium sp. DG1-102-2 TaxID=3081663 RepID=UPI002949F9B8|nr:PAS domain S-box protein [Flavobacterium sp. DG1-102-2]MDV6169242.1 PAS domain S-box protein [Flavobacterium sp. DG1-102-2]